MFLFMRVDSFFLKIVDEKPRFALQLHFQSEWRNPLAPRIFASLNV